MNMYSVLLIDDESWVLEDLKSLLNWEENGFKIIGEANDAESAKNIIETERPDVVISDIRMPGLSGIQLLETYQNADFSFKTIFVTAYGKFEYAKKALELGADGYLLKPVVTEELLTTLSKVKKQLDNNGATNTVLEWEKTQKLYALLDGVESEEESEKLFEEIGIPCVSETYVLVVIKEPYEKVKELFCDFSMHTTILSVSPKSCLVYIHSKTPYFNIITYKNMLLELKGISKNKDVCLGISRMTDKKRKFRIAYSQAESALYYSFVNRLRANVFSVKNENTQELISLISRQKSLTQKKEILNILSDELRQRHIYGKKLEEVLEHLVRQLDIDYDLYALDIKELTEQFVSVDKFLVYLDECINDSSRKRNKKTTSRGIVKEIIEYIQSGYDQKIMINDLAQQFFLNPSYLSNLFKQETGKSFTAYLVECRLKKAAEFLETTDLTLYEISAKVGYEDYFHFSKLFKKHMDISPANYRKNKMIDGFEGEKTE